LAKELAKREDIDRVRITDVFGRTFKNIFAGMAEEKHQSFAKRNSITLLLCFFLGYVGNGSLIPPYTADIATNASLLLSNFVGSALQKNMGRVQGLVIGSVIGRVIHAVLSMSDCSGSIFGVSMVATLGLFSMTSFYLFMSSETFAFTAYLFGGFGSMVILSDCSDSENTEAAYLSIVCATLCIITMAGVDMALAPSAADDAADAYLGFLRGTREAMVSMLTRSTLPEGHDTTELMCALDDTQRSAEEAAKAPSMVMKPFRLELFNGLVSSGKQSMIHIDTLSRAMLVRADKGMPDPTPAKYLNGNSPVTEILRTCSTYNDLSSRVEEVMLGSFLLAETSIKADTSLQAIHASKDIKMKVKETQEMLEQLAKEVGIETDGKFEETVIPLDKDTDTALQVTIKEMEMIISKAKEIKQHSMTHV